MNLSGKTAIITGGTGALGSVVASTMYGSGTNIAIPLFSHATAAAPGRDSARMFSARADLTVEGDVHDFVLSVLGKFGRVDILVNAAGGYTGGKLVEESAVNDFDAMMKLNFTSVLNTCRAVLPVMKKQGYGRIVNIAAMPALTVKPRMGPYSVSKRAVVTLTETIADEVKGQGVTVNAIAPSIILTPANQKGMPEADFSKWVTPEEIAVLTMFLCSDEAKSVNGNVIKIFGGV